MSTPVSRFRLVVAVACVSVVAFAFYVLQQVTDFVPSTAVPEAAKTASRPSTAAASASSLAAVARVAAETRDGPLDANAIMMSDQDTEPALPIDEPESSERTDQDIVPRDNAISAVDAVDAEDALEPDVVFEEVDPETVSAEIREKYAAGGHKRYRFVEIDGESLHARMGSGEVDDVLHIELFPGEVVSPIKGTVREEAAREGSELWTGGIENHPCSFFRLRVDAQGIVSVQSYHRLVPIFSVELSGQGSIYAITQSTNNNDPTCSD